MSRGGEGGKIDSVFANRLQGEMKQAFLSQKVGKGGGGEKGRGKHVPDFSLSTISIGFKRGRRGCFGS